MIFTRQNGFLGKRKSPKSPHFSEANLSCRERLFFSFTQRKDGFLNAFFFYR